MTTIYDFKSQFTEIEREKLVELSSQNLWLEDGKPGLDYLMNERRLKEDVIKKFKLGYIHADIEHQLADRILFPIYDTSENLIALHSCAINENNYLPRYWHEKFHKSYYLYGLNHAYKRIREVGFSIVCEGNFDILQCHNHGLTNVVAMFGKALSLVQISLLLRYSDEIVLMFDSDDSGRKSQEETLKMLKDYNSSLVKVSAVKWEDSEEKNDPDSYIRKNGIISLKKLVKDALLNG